mgnify:CR=1 FL=1
MHMYMRANSLVRVGVSHVLCVCVCVPYLSHVGNPPHNIYTIHLRRSWDHHHHSGAVQVGACDRDKGVGSLCVRQERGRQRQVCIDVKRFPQSVA